MAKPDADFGTNVDVWNIADGYVKLKILYLLVEVDKLQKIALFGCEHIDQSLMVTPQIKTQMRIEAISRFIASLKMVMENTLKLLKKPSRDTANSLFNRIEKVERGLGLITLKEINTVTKKVEITINEKHFNICMDVLRKIKTDLVKPLNDSNMIFPQGDELNLDEIKDKLIFGG